MPGKFTESENIKYITLDIQSLTKTNRKTFKDIKSKKEEKQKNGLSENEWLQEYKLIYDSQKLENWNIEEPGF